MAKLKFSFPAVQQPSKVYYGAGSLKVLADAAILDGAVVMISGQAQVRERFLEIVRSRGLDVPDDRVCVKPAGEPTLDAVHEGSRFLARHRARRLIGIGGGSVLDWCRLAWVHAAGLLVERQGRFAIEGSSQDGIDLWLVPTTCATGAEAAGVAVFSHQGAKVPVVTPLFIANHVVLDAHFLDKQSDGQLALSLCDALSHGIEAYCSVVPCYLAKEAACSAVWQILENFSDDHDPGARRERLLEAAYLGGLAASHCSVGVVHAFAHSIADDGVSHALGNALGLIAGVKANSRAGALGELARRVGCLGPDALVSRLRPIVSAALRTCDLSHVQALLGDDAWRNRVAARMAADPCLRTNPETIAGDDFTRFFDRVAETITISNG